jgi:hypothetical protein
MERWKDGKMERWKDGKMERWKEGKMERGKEPGSGERIAGEVVAYFSRNGVAVVTSQGFRWF